MIDRPASPHLAAVHVLLRSGEQGAGKAAGEGAKGNEKREPGRRGLRFDMQPPRPLPLNQYTLSAS